MTAHGALFGAVPYLPRVAVITGLLMFIGWKISGRAGAVVSLLTGTGTLIAMAVTPEADAKATVTLWCIAAGVAGMIVADHLPGRRRRR